MKKLVSAVAVALLVSAPLAVAQEAKKKAAAPEMKQEAVFLTPSDLKWGDAPPGLPKGAQLAVLEGDPSKNAPFTVRFKLPDGYKIAPHWHTKDENLTILSGTFMLHMGDKMDSPAHELTAGSFHFLPAKMHHAAEVKGETVLQLHGIGPFDINYLNPKDDPRKQSATK